MSRPDWDTYMMRLAYLAASRASCGRKHVGAILANASHRVIATGYNGAPKGRSSCDEVGHQIVDGHCVATLHAESNAIDYAGREAAGSTLYVTVTPCWDCAKRIVNAGIRRVVYHEHYESRYGKSSDTPHLLTESGMEVVRFDSESVTRFRDFVAELDK